MSSYGSRTISESPLDFEITKVDCSYKANGSVLVEKVVMAVASLLVGPS